jgi:hypothetical protein
MTVEKALRDRIERLAIESQQLRKTDENGQAVSELHVNQCSGWIAAALHAVEAASGGATNAYFELAKRIAAKEHAWAIPDAVGDLGEILFRMLQDIDAGLLGSVADRARAETFDNFLDHGRAYLDDGKVKEAGVIVGVVFEDSVRRICRKLSIVEQGVKLDSLISELVKANALTELKAKRARVAAGVRTKATHAQWDEFTQSDVVEAIALTRELVDSQLDA